LAHFCTGAFAENKRKHTKDEGKRGHQDRTQSKTARFDCGGETIFLVAILDLLREFDDQDRVFASEPNQHDKTDLGENVVLHRAQPDTVDRAEQTHRDDQNDGERQRPTFVKRREQEKNEEDAERKNVDRAVASKLLLERDLGPFGGETGGQNLFGETFNGCQCVASARARCGLTAEVGRSKHVVTSDLVRAAYFLHGRHRTEGNNST